MFEPISLDQLTVFLAVVENESFSAAARSLGRVQSAVSHSVSALEATLGTPLFDRRSRPPTLSDAGRRLAPEARLVLAQARAFRQVAGAMREGLEPELHVAVDAMYPTEHLASTLRAFHEAFPSVSLRVDTELLGDAVRRVVDGASDLGLCLLSDTHDDVLDVRPAGTMELVPVCAPSHPLAEQAPPQRTDRLRHYTQVVLSQRLFRSDDRGVLGMRTWRVTDVSTKLELLRAGVGWGSLPADMVRGAIASGELVRLHPEPWPDGRHLLELHTIVRLDRPLGPAGTWLRRHLRLAEPPRRPNSERAGRALRAR